MDAGQRPGVPSDVAEKLRALERKNRELRQANEILRCLKLYVAREVLGALCRNPAHPLELFPIEVDRKKSLVFCFGKQLYPTNGAGWSDVALEPLDQHRSINAPAETINGLYKAEVIHRRGPWRTMEAVEFATLAWVDWFNNHRLLEPIGYVPPAKAGASCYATLDDMPWPRSTQTNTLPTNPGRFSLVGVRDEMPPVELAGLPEQVARIPAVSRSSRQVAPEVAPRSGPVAPKQTPWQAYLRVTPNRIRAWLLHGF